MTLNLLINLLSKNNLHSPGFELATSLGKKKIGNQLPQNGKSNRDFRNVYKAMMPSGFDTNFGLWKPCTYRITRFLTIIWCKVSVVSMEIFISHELLNNYLQSIPPIRPLHPIRPNFSGIYFGLIGGIDCNCKQMQQF